MVLGKYSKIFVGLGISLVIYGVVFSLSCSYGKVTFSEMGGVCKNPFLLVLDFPFLIGMLLVLGAVSLKVKVDFTNPFLFYSLGVVVGGTVTVRIFYLIGKYVDNNKGSLKK